MSSYLTALMETARDLRRVKTDRRFFWLCLGILATQAMVVMGGIQARMLTVRMANLETTRVRAHDKTHAVAITPKAIIFKVRGYPSFRLSIRKRGNRLELYVRDTVAPKQAKR